MKNLSLLLLSAFILVSCGPKEIEQSGSTNSILSRYFSMRQQTPTTFVGIIQLKNPALLKTAKQVNGFPKIDEDLKQAIIAEQAEVIEQLQQVSSEIKIITKYRMVLNAIAFVAPSNVVDQLEKLEGVNKIIESTSFLRPEMTASLSLENSSGANSLSEKNSATFIGADKLYKLGIKGSTISVGVIDTGVDFTHQMLGGSGNTDVFKLINPTEPTNHFPNSKVKAGVDFAGSNYFAGGATDEQKIPVRDENPIDESGHGTHVAGTVAGIGDGVKSYNGVAPEANIYALKVFGKRGSTSDIVVIQALEYAADITESMNPFHRLDVVNLSLGGGFGKPQVLYTEAVNNLTKAGTIVVASAGNSGNTPYITGAPATADEAISVAASIDDMNHNIESEAVEATWKDGSQLMELAEATTTLPASVSKTSGMLLAIGTGAESLDPKVVETAKGKILLMDRGVISFQEKFEVAKKLNAIGVVVVNNVEGPANAMSSELPYDFSAVMITKAQGDKLKEVLKSMPVSFNFYSGKKILNLEKADTITNFSSRGPRSIDSLIKPEIAGPGANVISAAFGTGNDVVRFSGTSMSGPHIAGVMALLREAFPEASVEELKARVLNTAKILMKDGVHVPVARQGAGRVQVGEAYSTAVWAVPATLSLGEVPVASQKTVSKTITITNVFEKDLVFSTKVISSKNIKASVPASFRVKGKSTFKFNVSFTLNRENPEQNNIEADGFIILTSGDGKERINFPFLAVLNKVSSIEGGELVTQTDSIVDKVGAEVKLSLTNTSKSSGDALLFNLIAKDERKPARNINNASASTLCDLESAGVRVIEKNIDGQKKSMIQFGVKVFESMTSWQPCDVSVQFDYNNDGIADQELVGINNEYVEGIIQKGFGSLLLDAKMARQIRLDFENSPRENMEDYDLALLSYSPMKFYNHSNVAVVEADLSAMKILSDKPVGIKIAITHLEGDSNVDDFLGNQKDKWLKINLSPKALGYMNIPEVITVLGNDSEQVSLKRGQGKMKLMALYPHNSPENLKDKQSQVFTEKLLK